MTSLSELARILEPREAKILGAELRAGKSLGMAISAVSQERRATIRPLLEILCSTMEPTMVGDALSAISISAERATTQIDVVWSGPTPEGFMGRRTWAVAEDLISRAKEFIYAATYSAGKDSPYIKALKNAIARGIRVVCLVDPHALPEIAQMIRQELKGAEILGIASSPDGRHPLMHAKFLVIDGAHTFITSANFSVAAADISLETGLWVRNEFVSVQIKDHVDHLWEIGILTKFNALGS